MITSGFNHGSSATSASVTWGISSQTTARIKPTGRITSLESASTSKSTSALRSHLKPGLSLVSSQRGDASSGALPLSPPASAAGSEVDGDVCAVCNRLLCDVRSHIKPRAVACRVCNRPSCGLRSHKQYLLSAGYRQPRKQSSGRSLDHSLTPGAGYANSYVICQPLGNSTIDPFVALPGNQASDPTLNRLFHECEHWDP